jgi:hypothetical protein
MERGAEQLVILVVVIAFSLFDLAMRWLKRRAGGPVAAPPEVEGDDEAWTIPDIAVPSPPSVPLPSGRERSGPVPQRVVTFADPESRRPSRGPVVAPIRRSRIVRLGGARRGVVLHAILGPCRALERGS